MADYSSSPGGGWTLISSTSLLNTYKADLVSFYNSNGGLPVITPWRSTNCCFSLSSNLRWDIDGSYVYPAGCCNCGTYSGTYKFNLPGVQTKTSLSTETWSTTNRCLAANNPGIFYRHTI